VIKIIAVTSASAEAETCATIPPLRFPGDCHLGSAESALIPPIIAIPHPLQSFLLVPELPEKRILQLPAYPLSYVDFCRNCEEDTCHCACPCPQGGAKPADLSLNIMSLEAYKVCQNCGCFEACTALGTTQASLVRVDQWAIARGMDLIAKTRAHARRFVSDVPTPADPPGGSRIDLVNGNLMRQIYLTHTAGMAPPLLLTMNSMLIDAYNDFPLDYGRGWRLSVQPDLEIVNGGEYEDRRWKRRRQVDDRASPRGSARLECLRD
jgi:hypothetical protein